jgi:hypothetical protein
MIDSKLSNPYAIKTFTNAGNTNQRGNANIHICRFEDGISILSEPKDHNSRCGVEEINIKLDHLPEIFAELSRIYQVYKNQDQPDLTNVFDATTKVNTVTLLLC